MSNNFHSLAFYVIRRKQSVRNHIERGFCSAIATSPYLRRNRSRERRGVAIIERQQCFATASNAIMFTNVDSPSLAVARTFAVTNALSLAPKRSVGLP